MRERVVRAAALAGVAAVLLLAYKFGIFSEVADPKSLAQSLVAMGAWGYLAYLLAYAVLHPFGVPGTVFIVAASLIWPFPTAFALSLVGTMSGTVVGFAFSRFVARDWVAARIPARFRKYDEALAKSAFRTVVLLRTLFWSSQPLHAFFGVSKVSFRTHFWGSLVGYLHPILFVSYMGSKIFDEGGHLSLRVLPMWGGFVAFSLLLVLALRWCDRRQASA